MTIELDTFELLHLQSLLENHLDSDLSMKGASETILVKIHEAIHEENLSRDDSHEDMDGDHASALASAGLGTDEDYEHPGCDEGF